MAYKKPNIVNSQFVHIEQTPASIGQRILAAIIDYFVLIMYYSAVTSAVTTLIKAFGENNIIYLIAFLYLLPTLYAPIAEQFFNGLTLGKLALGIRVVMQNGEAVSASSSFLRWVMQPLDMGFCFVGLMVMMCNKRNLRIGDIAGGTIVIKDNVSWREMNALRQFSYIAEDYEPKYPFAANMSWGQINFINHTSSTPYLRKTSSEEIRNIEMLASMIANKYNIHLSPRDYNNFLCQIVKDYNYYTWHDNV